VLLHGCVGRCRAKVWGPEDVEDVCNLCGTSRYNDQGKPREFVVHFPLKKRFESLLQCPEYRKAVRWESQRTRVNINYMTGTSST